MSQFSLEPWRPLFNLGVALAPILESGTDGRLDDEIEELPKIPSGRRHVQYANIRALSARRSLLMLRIPYVCGDEKTALQQRLANLDAYIQACAAIGLRGRTWYMGARSFLLP